MRGRSHHPGLKDSSVSGPGMCPPTGLSLLEGAHPHLGWLGCLSGRVRTHTSSPLATTQAKKAVAPISGF